MPDDEKTALLREDWIAVLLGSPLGEATRRSRRALLASSCVGMIVIITRAPPTAITNLGWELSTAGQQKLAWFMFAAIFYFLASFAISAASDIVRVVRQRQADRFDRTHLDDERKHIAKSLVQDDSAREKETKHHTAHEAQQRRIDRLIADQRLTYLALPVGARRLGLLRTGWEIAFPVLLGVVAGVCVLVYWPCA